MHQAHLQSGHINNIARFNKTYLISKSHETHLTDLLSKYQQLGLVRLVLGKVLCQASLWKELHD